MGGRAAVRKGGWGSAVVTGGVGTCAPLPQLAGVGGVDMLSVETGVKRGQLPPQVWRPRRGLRASQRAGPGTC